MVESIRRRIRGVRAFMALVALASPWRRVVVGLAEAEVARLDLARGPFAPPSTGGEPLRSRWSQLQGVGPRQLKDLDGLLRSSPRGSWANHVRRHRRSTLYRASDELRDALAALGARVAELAAAEPAAKGRRAKELAAARILAPYTEVAERWLATSVWPWGMTLDGVETVLADIADDAMSARKEHGALYFWYGPAVPLVRLRLTREPDGRRTWTREEE
jgi:hypothetical protein